MSQHSLGVTNLNVKISSIHLSTISHHPPAFKEAMFLNSCLVSEDRDGQVGDKGCCGKST